MTACSLCQYLGHTCLECHAGNTHVTRLQAEVEDQKKQAAYNQEAALRWLAERDALKAELDALKAAQRQGEPVAWQTRRKTNRVGSNWTAWTQCSEMERALHSHEAGKFNRFGIMREIRPVYAEQPAPVADALRKNAERYQWLRERDLETILCGGVFAGQTPNNVVLNGEDLDTAIDAAMSKQVAP